MAPLLEHGDTVLIMNGVYENDKQVTISKDNIVILGYGVEKPVLRAGNIIANDSANGKGILVIKGNHVKVQHLIFENAKVPDKNGAGIRQEGCDLHVIDCDFRYNEMGILCGSIDDCKTTIEYCSFEGNGSAENPGYQHNVYINHIDTLIFRFNRTMDAVAEGHELKSRARFNFIGYNYILNSNSVDSRNIDLPNGGIAIVIGNVVTQGLNSANSNMIGYGLEGLSEGIPHELYVVNNTFDNARRQGSFVQLPTAMIDTAVIVNNGLAGENTNFVIGNTKTTFYSHNIEGAVEDLKFSNSGSGDYSILAVSPLVDNGISIASDDVEFGLSPKYEISSDLIVHKRFFDGKIDVGAYELDKTSSTSNATVGSKEIFPNPTGGSLCCHHVLSGYCSIVSVHGDVFRVLSEDGLLNVGALPEGQYFINIKGKQISFIKVNQ